MKRNFKLGIIFCSTLVAAILLGMSCGKSSTSDDKPEEGDGANGGSAAGAGSSGSSSTTTCSATENTTATTTLNSYNCPMLTRDTSSCEASRTAQGLSGFWLKFSCKVTLTKSGSNVTIATTDIPDSKSYYYNATDPCYQAFSSTARRANPNLIAAKTISVTVPYSPSVASSHAATPEGIIGIALNGVAIYDNSAAPGDDIYNEEATFDWCDGHPDVSSTYHYHSEPSSISNNDSAFIGVMRDGFPIYGRNDYASNTVVTGLDAQGGKTSTTVDSPSTPVYHYHLNLQTNGVKSVYFISAGAYAGTPGTCTGCQ